MSSTQGRPCRNWQQTGHCSFGEKCHFAWSHTDDWKPHSSTHYSGSRGSPNTRGYSTTSRGRGGGGNNVVRGCQNWAATGTCSYGSKCWFAWSHTPSDASNWREQAAASSSSAHASTSTTNTHPNHTNGFDIDDEGEDVSDAFEDFLANLPTPPGVFVGGAPEQNPLQWDKYGSFLSPEEVYHLTLSDDSTSMGMSDDRHFSRPFTTHPASALSPVEMAESAVANYSDGCLCFIDGCNGKLLGHRSDTTGQISFFQCNQCGALCTNNT
mmetsp:Transcript_1818/g.2608  ORF Transcript_1818/g.2608 Transcript_1818/m.2608 type:complete len:268 (+) Transcript_1818:6-809(+)